MTVLIDPPAWPAHGTLFSHLVSDTSLHELRRFARAAGVPDRALDLDHYDVPAERYDGLVAAGAVPVDGRDLARRLGGSVLRVSGAERRRAGRAALAARWSALDPASAAGMAVATIPTPIHATAIPTAPEPGAWAAVGADLLDRWREPHRVYHGPLHLAQALDALELLLGDLADAGTPAPPETAWAVRVALWFHDAVHDGEAGIDEQRSADLARAALSAVGTAAAVGMDVATIPPRIHATAIPTTTGMVEEVARLVLVTAAHDPEPGDLAGALVSDADLAVLGASSAGYARYAQQVRAEYADVPDDAFRHGRADVLAALPAGGPLFRTAQGARRWQARAEENLRGELRALRSGTA